MKLINSVIKYWRADCIFFLNYKLINMGLNNKLMEEHMKFFLGKERFYRLVYKLEYQDPKQRENIILEEIVSLCSEEVNKYILPFKFKNKRGTHTTHYLLYAGKSASAYTIMKNIMAEYSSRSFQGVPSYEYCPYHKSYPLLFDLNNPLDNLSELLMTDFAGKKLTFREIFETHHPGKPYIEKNYREVIKRLEKEGKVIVENPSTEEEDNIIVEFPGKS